MIDCPPRFATPADPTRDNNVDVARMIARRMQHPFMPWQDHVSGIGSEIGDDGYPAYDEVRITLGRQNGKTELSVNPVMERIVFKPNNRRAAWVGQSLNDTIAKWEHEIYPRLKEQGWEKQFGMSLHRSPANPQLVVRPLVGEPGVMRISGSSDSSGHGLSLPLIVYDECWEYKDSSREQAYGPTQLAFPDSQSWKVSTVGKDLGSWWHEQTKAGRLMALHPGARVAYFEWSVPRDGDIDDPAVVAAANPAVGHTIRLKDLMAKRDLLSDEDFRRAHCNQWPAQAAVVDRAIPEEIWDRAIVVVAPVTAVATSRRVLAIDTPPSESHTSIAWADGASVDLIACRPGLDWVPSYVMNLRAARNDIAAVAGMRNGPANDALEQIERMGVSIVWYNNARLGSASSAFSTGLAAAKIKVGADDAWANAVGGCVWIDLGYGAVKTRVFGGFDKTVVLAPLWSAVMAWHVAQWSAHDDVGVFSSRNADLSEEREEWRSIWSDAKKHARKSKEDNTPTDPPQGGVW